MEEHFSIHKVLSSIPSMRGWGLSQATFPSGVPIVEHEEHHLAPHDPQVMGSWESLKISVFALFLNQKVTLSEETWPFLQLTCFVVFANFVFQEGVLW